MRAKPLVETNPYLKDPDLRAQLLAWAVSTSTSIETIRAIAPRARFPVKADMLETQPPTLPGLVRSASIGRPVTRE